MSAQDKDNEKDNDKDNDNNIDKDQEHVEPAEGGSHNEALPLPFASIIHLYLSAEDKDKDNDNNKDKD